MNSRYDPCLCGTHSHLGFATLPLPIPSVALKLTASSRLLAPPSGSPKCLRFSLWLTLCTLKIDLRTYLLTCLRWIISSVKTFIYLLTYWCVYAGSYPLWNCGIPCVYMRDLQPSDWYRSAEKLSTCNDFNVAVVTDAGLITAIVFGADSAQNVYCICENVITWHGWRPADLLVACDTIMLLILLDYCKCLVNRQIRM